MSATNRYAHGLSQQHALTRVLWRSLCANVGRHATPSPIGGEGCDFGRALLVARTCTGDDAGAVA